MFNIDSRNNITLNAYDTAVIDFRLCGCKDKLQDGDIVTFHTKEPQEVTVNTFLDGVARIEIPSKEGEYKGKYCIRVQMKDGRKAVVIEGNYIRGNEC